VAVLGALIALNLRSAFVWFVVFTVSVIAAAWLPTWIGAIYPVEASAAELAINISGVTVLVFATMAYFVRQRDRFQRQSDDLLHNILPHEIAKRLKAENKMIADHFESASVLFADVVDFTPMSAGMSPAELIGLLNEVFSAFDRFVDELGLEKIKTVGDEYMVASGVPVERPDHAESLAELALRIRDFVASNTFNGHKIELRIGIHSGPVVAGVIGIHKYAYDLWGDSVNTASRMESEGLAGSIQVSATTYELIRDSFVCEPRGVVSVKGKGDLFTYFLVGRHADAARARLPAYRNDSSLL
jgi:guanylate cyclase